MQVPGINDILLKTETPSAMLAGLYRLHKAFHSKYSLEFLRKITGLRSRGHLGDIMQGRRPVSLKLLEKFAAAFQLNEVQSDVLYKMLSVCNAETIETQHEASCALATSRRILAVQSSFLSLDEMPGLFFSFETFCAIHLFKDPPSRADLLGYFGSERSRDLDAAIRYLVQHGFLVADDQGLLRLTRSHMVINADKNKIPVEYFRAALDDASQRLSVWADQRDLAHFEATIISTNQDNFVKIMPQIRRDLLAIQAKIDQEESADLLVRFNVQIYPTKGSNR